MLAVILFGLVATTLAAPYKHHMENFSAKIFSSNTLRMRKIDEIIGKLHDNFDTANNNTKIEDNEFIITIPLSPFNEEDIIVRALAGLVVVLAVNNPARGGKISYADVKTLPADVEASGTWTFDSEKNLSIVFPITGKVSNKDMKNTLKVNKVDLNTDGDDILATLKDIQNPFTSSAVFENDMLVIEEQLQSFDEKDIFVVKYEHGSLMMQAVHNTPEGGEIIRHRQNNLPPVVDKMISWEFTKNKALKVTFSLKKETD